MIVLPVTFNATYFNRTKSGIEIASQGAAGRRQLTILIVPKVALKVKKSIFQFRFIIHLTCTILAFIANGKMLIFAPQKEY